MMKQFDVEVKYKGRERSTTEWVYADSVTKDNDTYHFWLHNIDASGEVVREMTASFPVADVHAVKESHSPVPAVSDTAVIRRVVDVIIVYVVEKAKADGEPLSEEQEKQAHRDWTAKFKKVFAAARGGSNAVREFLATANQVLNMLG